MTAAHPEASAPAEPWLPLLRELTEVEPTWCVWKNADDAAAGRGDVDSAAPPRAWPGITEAFRRWASATGARPVIVCTHAPGTLVAVACAADDRRRLLQLDVYDRVARLVPAEALVATAQTDERGFRSLRPGSEGLLLLLALSRRPGRPPREGSALPRIASLLRSDPEGVERAARLLGAGRRLALTGGRAVADGGWNRGAMTALELVYAWRAAREPRRRLDWLGYRIGSGHRCPLLAALADDRRVTGDVDRWLARVATTHAVFES